MENMYLNDTTNSLANYYWSIITTTHQIPEKNKSNYNLFVVQNIICSTINDSHHHTYHQMKHTQQQLFCYQKDVWTQVFYNPLQLLVLWNILLLLLNWVVKRISSKWIFSSFGYPENCIVIAWDIGPRIT